MKQSKYPKYGSEYKAWVSMRGRCYNPNNSKYYRYGGRGIQVCEEWLSSFDNFYRYVGPKPGSNYTLDRIDNDGHYEPGNVRWATPEEQANNKSNTIKLKSIDGTLRILKDISDELEISKDNLLYRVNHQLPLNTPVREVTPYKTYKGKLYSTKQLSEMTGLSCNVINKRLSKGWSVEKTIETPYRDIKLKVDSSIVNLYIEAIKKRFNLPF